MMQSFKEKASPDILYGETAIVNGEGEFYICAG